MEQRGDRPGNIRQTANSREYDENRQLQPQHAEDDCAIMFQRLQKGLNLDFLDSKIAEEQEKQKQQQQQSRNGSPAKRTPSVRRGSGRTDSPSTRPRAGSRLRVADAKAGEAGPATKGPDPDDFVIGDDASDISSSRAPTPLPTKEGEGEGAEKSVKKTEVGASSEGSEKGKERADEDGLPLEVRQKLAKLETLTTRYQGMQRPRPLLDPSDLLTELTMYRSSSQLSYRTCPRSIHRAVRGNPSRTHAPDIHFRSRCPRRIPQSAQLTEQYGYGRAEED